ncbi:MAG TPA: condensation domain-containing protein, partial [Thermomicrobiales bacterium]|nr:condensation domain-containing protein [Thermomicrobiales bacterium]
MKGALNALLEWREDRVAGQAEAAAPTAPRNETERALAEIWREVLDLESASIDDNFFDQGGQSLLATQLLARIREAFGIELPLRALFESPTIAELAERIGRLSAGAEDSGPPLVRAQREGELPLSFAQQRLWFLEQIEHSPCYNVPAWARLRGALDYEALERSINEIVHRHEALRTNFRANAGRPLQTIHADRRMRLSRVDLVAGLPKAAPAERLAEAQRRAADAAAAPFDLEGAPLVRATLYRLSDRDHLLALTAHHIVVDGWSMGVFLKELAALYESYVEDRPAQLADLPLQYADFAVWQRAWLASPAAERQLAYWTDRFAELPPALDLPTDRPRTADARYRPASEQCELPAALQARLEQLSRG